MEDNNQINSQTSTPVEETCKCANCGRILPISKFERFGKHGYHRCCKACEGREYSTDERFKDIPSCDLVLELRARGYKGKLQKVTVEDFVM